MADNVGIKTGTDASVAADDISSVLYQRIKLIHGADGTNNGDVSTFNGLPVQSARVSTATLTNVSASASSGSLVVSNTSRKGLIVFNDSAVNLYLKYGTTASATSYTVKISPYALWEMPSPIYSGDVDVIWDSATGAARVTEL